MMPTHPAVHPLLSPLLSPLLLLLLILFPSASAAGSSYLRVTSSVELWTSRLEQQPSLLLKPTRRLPTAPNTLTLDLSTTYQRILGFARRLHRGRRHHPPAPVPHPAGGGHRRLLQPRARPRLHAGPCAHQLLRLLHILLQLRRRRRRLRTRPLRPHPAPRQSVPHPPHPARAEGVGAVVGGFGLRLSPDLVVVTLEALVLLLLVLLLGGVAGCACAEAVRLAVVAAGMDEGQRADDGLVLPLPEGGQALPHRLGRLLRPLARGLRGLRHPLPRPHRAERAGVRGAVGGVHVHAGRAGGVRDGLPRAGAEAAWGRG